MFTQTEFRKLEACQDLVGNGHLTSHSLPHAVFSEFIKILSFIGHLKDDFAGEMICRERVYYLQLAFTV